MKVYIVRETYRNTARIESVWDTKEAARYYLDSGCKYYSTPTGMEYWRYTYKDGTWVNLYIEEWEVKRG